MPRPTLIRALLLQALALAGPVGAQPERVYELAIEARYDDSTHEIEGRERWRWTNRTSAPVTELQFHLYLNAFAHDDTTFMLESGDSPVAGGEGWVEVKSLRLADGTDLKGRERFLAPEDGNRRDQTLAAYPLPTPLAPGGTLELALDFRARLPAIIARTGVQGDYVLAGQWFPKLAVLEDAGVRGRAAAGWSAHQFHAWSEFYADFGDYDVTLDLPARYAGRIGATGELREEKKDGERVRAHFVARGVHDFAWTADPDYEVIEERFDPARDVPPALAARITHLLGKSTALSPVRLRLLLQPEHRARGPRYLEAARATLASLGLRLGAYPYPGLTLVDPPADDAGSGGMEYPTLVTLGTGGVPPLPGTASWLWPELVTAHEIAHQYWYGMVASNEVEESWIDEGLSAYYETEVMSDRYGDTLACAFGLRFGFADDHRLGLLAARFSDPVVTPTWRFRNWDSWASNSYGRPALALKQLERLAGAAPFAQAMRRFFERWQWRHPGTRDFEADITEALAGAMQRRELESFLRQALHTTRVLDFALERLDSEWVDGTDEDRGFYRSTVEVGRRGEMRQPIVLRLRFADGAESRLSWDGQRRWKRWQLEGPERLVEAEIDPDGILALEADRLNNSRSADPDPRPRRQALGYLAGWLQTLFQALSFFG